MPTSMEVNLDGLPGPTHNYAGLAFGNLASMANRWQVSNPKAAALQGLRKMELFMELGLHQGVLPPQERPDLNLLRRAGFCGSDSTILQRALDREPELFTAAYSASAMWVANAATVSPSADTADGRVHFTPANLSTHVHRALETEATRRLLRTVFSDEEFFEVHSPLPAGASLRDEGAANHVRLCAEHGSAGLEVFVYGSEGGTSAATRRENEMRAFPARQSHAASRAVARLHQLDPDRVVFARQNPEAVERGVFHNDLISTGNERVLIVHDSAFVHQDATLKAIAAQYARSIGEPLCLIEVRAKRISLADVLESYLFNSQLVSLPDGSMCLVAPVECRESEPVCAWIRELLAQDNPLRKVAYVDLRESMRNGGGPACLRLRVVLNEVEKRKMHRGILLTPQLLNSLESWVERHYRDRLQIEDLTDIAFVEETREALDRLTQILELGALFPFQRE